MSAKYVVQYSNNSIITVNSRYVRKAVERIILPDNKYIIARWNIFYTKKRKQNEIDSQFSSPAQTEN